MVEQSSRPLADAAMGLGDLDGVSVAILLIGQRGNYTTEQLKVLGELVDELMTQFPEATLDASRLQDFDLNTAINKGLV